MAKERRQARRRPQAVRWKKTAWIPVRVPFEPGRQRRRYRSLGKIKNENNDAKASSQNAPYVGGADVAAALVQDIYAPAKRDEIAERDRAQEIGGDQGQGGDNNGSHGESRDVGPMGIRTLVFIISGRV